MGNIFENFGNTTILTNAFSLQMVPDDCTIKKEALTELGAAALVRKAQDQGTLTNAIGHADIARVIGRDLTLGAIEPNRISVTMGPNDVLVVGQYIGPRLPEGATELPEGAEVRYFKISLV